MMNEDLFALVLTFVFMAYVAWLVQRGVRDDEDGDTR